MLRLAVATRAETYERMGEPLADRGIDVTHVETAERTIAVDTDTFADFDAGFVFPPRIAEGGVADALLGVPWVNGREQVLRSRHKGETLARLSTAGVPVPETVVVSDPTDEAALRAAFERFEPPVVVKPNSATRGIGVAKAGDIDSFLGVCDYLDLVHDYRATGDCSFLVQEYVAGARDYRAMVIEGECVGGVERRLPEKAIADGQWKHNVHRGARATGVDLPADLRDLAARAADALDIPWLGVDLLVTDDRALVNETNARPTIDTATKYDAGFWDNVAALIRATAR
jgi:ribosomal protein S6--L-glutamate ligase